MSKEDVKYEKLSYKSYIEFNEGLEYKRENINITEKSEIVKILKAEKNAKSNSLTLLVDIHFPKGYIFSIAGRTQTQDIEEFNSLFTLSLKLENGDKKEINPETRIYIHKEKDTDEYSTNVVRLEQTFYKNVSFTKFSKEMHNSVKTIDDLYKLDQGAEFKEDEHLRIYVVNPDIDISPENVEFRLNLDKWDY